MNWNTEYHIRSNAYREAVEKITEHGSREGTLSLGQESIQSLLIHPGHSLQVQTARVRKLESAARKDELVKQREQFCLYQSNRENMPRLPKLNVLG